MVVGGVNKSDASTERAFVGLNVRYTHASRTEEKLVQSLLNRFYPAIQKSACFIQVDLTGEVPHAVDLRIFQKRKYSNEIIKYPS